MESLSKQESLEARIDQAFEEIDRADFLHFGKRHLAKSPKHVVIGHGQVNSEPGIVRDMLLLLEPKEGEKILDVGSGSGWTTALLGHLVGSSGRVIGTELIHELAKFGERNLGKTSLKNSVIYHTPDELGYRDEAPFDAVLVSAGIDTGTGVGSKISPPTQELLGQLKLGGRIVSPLGLTGKRHLENRGDSIRVDPKEKKAWKESQEDIFGHLELWQKTAPDDYEIISKAMDMISITMDDGSSGEILAPIDVQFVPLVTDQGSS